MHPCGIGGSARVFRRVELAIRRALDQTPRAVNGLVYISPDSSYPDAIIDCKAAVRWLRAHAEKYGIDSDRIGVFGESADGHPAQFLGVTNGVEEFDFGDPLDQSSTVACVEDCYGPCDLTRSYGRSVDANIGLLLF